MPTLHQMQMSGNCYKIRLAAAQLGIPIRLVEYPLFAGKTRTPAFRAKNVTAQWFEVVGNTPEEFAAFLKTEYEHWDRLIRLSGVKVE